MWRAVYHTRWPTVMNEARATHVSPATKTHALAPRSMIIAEPMAMRSLSVRSAIPSFAVTPTDSARARA